MLALRAGFRAARRAPLASRRALSTTRVSLQQADDEDKEFLTLNFSSPYGPVYKAAQVSGVYVPGEDGEFGIMPSHVPIIAQLRPGLVRVALSENEDAPTEDWFVTGGFATNDADSVANISASEVYKLSDFDADRVERLLREFQAKVDGAGEDSREQIEAQIAVDSLSALASALGVGAEKEE